MSPAGSSGEERDGSVVWLFLDLWSTCHIAGYPGYLWIAVGAVDVQVLFWEVPIVPVAVAICLPQIWLFFCDQEYCGFGHCLWKIKNY